MANEPDYICSNCHQEIDRELLTVVKVSFNEMGVGGRTLRSRVIAWLCPKCLKENPHWNRVPFQDTPGHHGVVQNAS